MECRYERFIDDLIDGRLKREREIELYEHSKECSICSCRLNRIKVIDNMAADIMQNYTFVSSKEKIMERAKGKNVFSAIKPVLFRTRKAAYAFCIILLLGLSIFCLKPFFDTYTPNAGGEALNGPAPASSFGVVYKNQEYGFMLTFPAAWKDKYIVEQGNNIVRIQHKETFEKTGAGTIFTLTIFQPKDKWDTEGLELQDMIGLKKIFENDRVAIGFSRPTDVQNIADDSRIRDEYEKMESDVDEIVKTIKAIN